MRIVLHTLKQQCEAMLKKAQLITLGTINFHTDWFWWIGLSESYNQTTTAPEISVGSIADELEFLEPILHQNGRSDTCHFDKLGDIITILGCELLQSNEQKTKPFLVVNIADLLRLSVQLLTKAELAGFKEIEVPFDRYWTIPLNKICNIIDEPEAIVQSLENSWAELISFNREKNLTEKDFEHLGRMLKVVGEMISRSISAHEEPGINWLCSDYDGKIEN